MFENFASYDYYVTASLCVLAMLGMGTTLSTLEFRDVARRPQCLFLVLTVQLIVAPLLALGLARVFQVPTGVAIGMLVVTALPGGLFSNMFALLSRSLVALSISATAVCTLGSLVTTTLVLKAFGSSHIPPHIPMPVGHIVLEICCGLLLPLIVGMAIRRHRPEHAKWIGRIALRAATALLVFYVVASFQSGRIDLTAFGWKTHAAIILLDVLQIAACALLAWVFRVTALESFTCQLEVVIRNVHIGLMLSASLFTAQAEPQTSAAVVFVLLYYGGASIVTGIVMTVIRRIELRVLQEHAQASAPPELTGG